MNDYQLGMKLRRQILADFERGISSDSRRYQALLSDFCGDSQTLLLPALKHLVQTAAFQAAVAERPPLQSETQLQLRLQQDLEALFAPALCLRMADVVRGLLGLQAAASAPHVDNYPHVDNHEDQDEDDDEDEEYEPALELTSPPVPSRSGGRGVVALLSFIAGVLVVGVVGALTWLVLLNRGELAPERSTPTALTGSEPAAPSKENPPIEPPVVDPDLLSREQAIDTVRRLYDDIALGNTAAAQQWFSPQAADQFNPAFFRQFQRVAVDNLQEVSRQGSLVTLQGVVTFVYPDGTSQSESRNFTVDTASAPALITASSFGQVLSPRSQR